MRIGVPKEIKAQENRVAITPAGVVSLVQAGHQVTVEKNAGLGSGYTNEDYAAAGAQVADEAAAVWSGAELELKVKEPLPAEYDYFRPGLILFTYLHLAAAPGLAEALMSSGVIAIAYETVSSGRALPLLTPMSEVAGRMSVQIAAQFLQKPYGGGGVLLSGVPGVERARVSIIGGGVVGTNAARIALGLGADVTIVDVAAERLRQLDDMFGGQLKTLMSNAYNIARAVAEADVLIGAVLIPGAKAPRLVTERMVRAMKRGSVIVDVAIDQGGIVETIDRITTHDNPVFEKHGVLHYSVANMPGAVPRTSTQALTNVTIPYAMEIAGKGAAQAIRASDALRSGLNVAGGRITNAAVADALKLICVRPLDALPEPAPV